MKNISGKLMTDEVDFALSLNEFLTSLFIGGRREVEGKKIKKVSISRTEKHFPGGKVKC